MKGGGDWRLKIWFNPPFLSKCLYQVRVITVFTVFQLLTDFVCLYTYEFWLSFCKIVRSSVILLLPLCNQYLSPLTLCIIIPLRQGVLDTTLCDKVRQCLATGWWFSPDTLVSSTNIANRHNINEILLKVALNTT